MYIWVVNDQMRCVGALHIGKSMNKLHGTDRNHGYDMWTTRVICPIDIYVLLLMNRLQSNSPTTSYFVHYQNTTFIKKSNHAALVSEMRRIEIIGEL